MKKTIFFLIALTWVSSVVWGNVKGASKSRVKVLQRGNIVKVICSNSTPGKVTITIMNERAVKVFSETIHESGTFMRPYNFTGLEEGTYWVKVEDHNSEHIEKVKYIEPKPEEEQLQAYVTRLENNQYLLSVSNDGKKEFDITVMDETNNILYQNNKAVSGDFCVLYCIENQEGDIIIQVENSKEGTERSFRFQPF